jgi:O-antigen/teichoic acid export membrane protein
MATRVRADRNLTRKASLNAAASFVDYAARAVVGFLLNPFIVTHLGDSGFGTWQFLQRLIGHTTPAAGRPGEALKWVVAHEQSSTDYDAKRRQVGNAVTVWILFLPLLSVVGGVLSWFAPTWLDSPTHQYPTVRLAAAVLVANVVLAAVANLPQSVLQGENLGYKRLGQSTAVVLLGGLLAAAALMLDLGLVGLAGAMVVTTLLSGATYFRIVRSHVRWFGIARPPLHATLQFIRLSWWFLLWNLVMQAIKGSDVILLGVVASSMLVTTYSLTSYVPQMISDTVFLVISAVMPGLGRLVGAGDLPRAAAVRNETMALTWLLCTAAGATTLLWERSFLGLWVGERYYVGTTAMLLIVVMILQLALIRTDSNVIDLTLDLRRKVLLGLLSTCLSVLLAWLFLGPFDLGIAGLVCGFLAGRSVLSVAYALMIGRLLDIPLGRQFAGALRPALATAVLFGGASVLGTKASTGSWATLVLACAVSMVVASTLAFVGGLARWQRAAVLARARRAFRSV